MGPIQFLFTSAIVLSAAVAAPIDSSHVGAGKAGVVSQLLRDLDGDID